MAYENNTSIEPAIEKPTMERILDRINDLHSVAIRIEVITERLCGGNRDSGKVGPIPVPDGLVDQIADGLRGLQDRLELASNRLGTIA